MENVQFTKALNPNSCEVAISATGKVSMTVKAYGESAVASADEAIEVLLSSFKRLSDGAKELAESAKS